MQGSGTLTQNRILTYNGKIKHLGDCSTSIGATGACMKPYISIAVDPRHYSMGDIIFIPSFKGKVIQLDNGEQFIHNGYFLAQDVGTSVRGTNHFDVYTGSNDPRRNITNKMVCTKNLPFEVLRKSTRSHSLALMEMNGNTTLPAERKNKDSVKGFDKKNENKSR